MPARYDLLVIDLDGTLLSRDGGVSTANRRAISRARDAGIEVIIATGRALNESRRAIEAVEHLGLVVAAGGSLLCDASTGCTIDRRVLAPDIVQDVTEKLLEHGHRVLILKDSHATGFDYLAVGDNDLDPASVWWFDHLDVKVRHVPAIAHDLHPGHTVRVGAVACHTRLAPLAGDLKSKLADRCCLQHWSAVTESHAIGAATHLLEVFTINVNKWTMIKSHCERWGIDPARVAAIGDGINDLELVQNAGLGIAMGNAGAEVKAVAQRHTADHHADGVAQAIDQILCGAW